MKSKLGNKSNLIILEFIIRLAVFSFVVACYFLYGNIAAIVVDTPFFGRFTIVHLVWLLMMAGMVLHLFPNNTGWAANNKQFSEVPHEQQYNQALLHQEVRKMNDGARKVLALWISIIVVVMALYFYGIISGSGIILIVMVFYICDAVCMFVWCPLQHFFMKTRCCVNCRIYGWGYFLVYAPLFMIVDIFTWSLALVALALLIRWEITYARHTERFWAGSNPALRCGNCAEQSCRFKRHLASLRQNR